MYLLSTDESEFNINLETLETDTSGYKGTEEN